MRLGDGKSPRPGAAESSRARQGRERRGKGVEGLGEEGWRRTFLDTVAGPSGALLCCALAGSSERAAPRVFLTAASTIQVLLCRGFRLLLLLPPAPPPPRPWPCPWGCCCC